MRIRGCCRPSMNATTPCQKNERFSCHPLGPLKDVTYEELVEFS